MFLFVCSWRKIKRFDQVSSDGRQKMKGENIFSPQKAERGEGSSFHASTSYRPSAPLEKKKQKTIVLANFSFHISKHDLIYSVQLLLAERHYHQPCQGCRLTDWLTDCIRCWVQPFSANIRHTPHRQPGVSEQEGGENKKCSKSEGKESIWRLFNIFCFSFLIQFFFKTVSPLHQRPAWRVGSVQLRLHVKNLQSKSIQKS